MKTLQAVVDELPSTVDEIVELLRKEGVKGKRQSACDCPIANLLSSKIGRRVIVSPKDCALSDSQYSIRLPSSAIRFISEFDGLQHQEFTLSP